MSPLTRTITSISQGLRLALWTTAISELTTYSCLSTVGKAASVVHVTGYTTGALTAGSGSADEADCYLAKCSTMWAVGGSRVWAAQDGTASTDRATAVYTTALSLDILRAVWPGLALVVRTGY